MLKTRSIYLTSAIGTGSWQTDGQNYDSWYALSRLSYMFLLSRVKTISYRNWICDIDPSLAGLGDWHQRRLTLTDSDWQVLSAHPPRCSESGCEWRHRRLAWAGPLQLCGVWPAWVSCSLSVAVEFRGSRMCEKLMCWRCDIVPTSTYSIVLLSGRIIRVR